MKSVFSHRIDPEDYPFVLGLKFFISVASGVLNSAGPILEYSAAWHRIELIPGSALMLKQNCLLGCCLLVSALISGTVARCPGNLVQECSLDQLSVACAFNDRGSILRRFLLNSIVVMVFTGKGTHHRINVKWGYVCSV